MAILTKKIERSFSLTKDLVNHLAEPALQLALSNLPANTIGEQLWCVVGARESYLVAIQNSGWVDFTCTLKDTTSKTEVLKAVTHSADAVVSFLEENTLTGIQLDFAFELLEHEIMHHGQLIRYIYGNKLSFPQSWKDRYTV